MSLVPRAPMDVAEPARPAAQGSLWILKLWLAAVVLGYVLGACYGQWLPRLCQSARRGVTQWSYRASVWWEGCYSKGRKGIAKLLTFLEVQFPKQKSGDSVMSPVRAPRTRGVSEPSPG